MASRIIALILAAGLSTRFGGDKLIHPYRGKPLAAHIADVIARTRVNGKLAVCPTTNLARQEIFRERGFEIIGNDSPSVGLSSSLVLGARRAIELDADVLVVCLADMPHITAGHIAQLVAGLDEDAAIVASHAGGTRSPPVAFARRAIDELQSLEGDSGARALLAGAKVIDMSFDLAADFDTRADFAG